MTKINKETRQKVHYPLPMMPLETDKPHTLDPQIIKMMIAKMGKSMTSIHRQMDQSHSSSFRGSDTSSDRHFVTARSFFSKDNPDHPTVLENAKLKERLVKL